MSTSVDEKKRTTLRNLAAMTESPNEQEILTAASMLNRSLRKIGLTWDQVFGIEPGFHAAPKVQPERCAKSRPKKAAKPKTPDRDDAYLDLAKRIQQSPNFDELHDNSRSFVGDVVDELKSGLSPKQRRWLWKLAKVARVQLNDLDAVTTDAHNNFGQ